MCRNYASADTVLDLPYDHGLALLRHGAAQEAKRRSEQRTWETWLAIYPHMIVPSPHTKGNKPLLKFTPYSQFQQQVTQPVTHGPERTSAEVIEMAERIRAADRKGR